MRRENTIYLLIPVAVVLLFVDSRLAFFVLIAGALIILYGKGFFHVLWRLFRQRKIKQPEASVEATQEPTMITLVARAPEELLGLDPEAGTGTIINSFYEKMKIERGDDLRLSRKGRRLTAAKNAMMSRRRKFKQGKAALDSSLSAFLANRPIFTGKVVQYKNLSPTSLEKYVVGREVDGLAGLSSTTERPIENLRGTHRFIIQSKSGRLLSDAGEGQVAFLPGTRFLVVSKSPWKNPDAPDSGEGFTFELAEVV